MSKCFAVVNASDSDITAVAARWNKNGDYILEGFSRIRSKGFNKGIITDAALATDSFALVLDKLKKATNGSIQDVYVAVSSTSVEVKPALGTLLLSKFGRNITERDVSKCVEVGSAVKLPLDREPLHNIVMGFSVDDDGEIKNPVNLEGVKLGVNMNIVTINSSVLTNMAKCISHAGFVPSGFIFSAIASARRVLSEDEMETGAALIDISADMTEVAVFVRGVLTGCKVFSLGTSDIMLEDGHIDTSPVEEVMSSIRELTGWDKVKQVVVIGDGTHEDDLIESLEKRFNCPVRAGVCAVKPFEDLPPERMGYIESLGILDHLNVERKKKRQERNILKRTYNKVVGFLERYF